MKTISVCILLIITLLAFAAEAETYIRSIDIVRLNVFDNHLEHGGNFIYRLGNKFHVVTKEQVIKRELLFDRGDLYDKEALDQSVRNIRALPFIGEVITDIQTAGEDSVDIKITTEDLWTTIFGVSSEGGGGFYRFSIYADEKNIAGLGIGVETDLQFTSDNNDGYSFHLFDYRFLGTRNVADLIVKNFSFEDVHSLTLFRPLYSVDARWTYTVQYFGQRLQARLFDEGEKYFQYKTEYTNWAMAGARAFGRYTRLMPNIQFNYSQSGYTELPDYPDTGGVIPDDETIGGPGFGLKFSTFRYKTATYLDEFGTTEDLTEHVFISANVLRSNSAFGADYNATLVSLEAGFFAQPVSGVYAGFKNIYTHNYVGDLKRDRIANVMESILYVKPSAYHLLALRAVTSFAWRQKANYFLFLGGDNGLRGYPDRYFRGTKLALINTEYRVFSPIEVLTVGLGAAAFLDAGYIWDEHEKIGLSDLRSDIGLGLRFGLTKSSTARIIRFDMARAINDNNWYISFGTENLFSLGPFQ